jgi:GDPmannose 4,6-dehydratase
LKKIALLTGASGQDASYLAEILLAKNYEVHGVLRRSSSPEYHTKRIDHIFDAESRTYLHYGDITEGLDNIILKVKPDYIYNLCAQSHVWVSFKQPIYTAETNAIGVLRLLETVKRAEQILNKQIRVYQASSSELWGITPPIQNEDSKMQPQSPYGCAKLFAYWCVKNYRTGYNMFTANGILHNHSSPRRGVNFASRKITRSAARIALGLQKQIELGNLDSIRDEGHSKDYMRAANLILEHDKADDFVIATGEGHTIREFAEKAFKHFNLNFYDYLVVNEELKRANEVPALIGDSTKARTILNWIPEYTFDSLITEMCLSDYELEKAKIK